MRALHQLDLQQTLTTRANVRVIRIHHSEIGGILTILYEALVRQESVPESAPRLLLQTAHVSLMAPFQ